MRVGQDIGGRFVTEREVAAGGVGRIFQARDGQTGGAVALKVLSTDDVDNAERFVREAMVLARIQHPNVVRYVAHGRTEDGSPYLAMEWLEGEDLAQRLARHAQRFSATLPSGHEPEVHSSGGALTVDETLLLGRRVASALAELHRAGIVHRDIKPSNLFLLDGSVDRIKVLDFGTARAVAETHEITHTGVFVGTPSYMAPEQARAERFIGPAADVWALGCVLYKCLAGVAPFCGKHIAALMAKILVDEPMAIDAIRPDAPAALTVLIGRMLAKDPAARPRDGAALLGELEEVDTLDDAPTTEIRRAALTSNESRIRCVLVTRAETIEPEHLGELAATTKRHGGHLERLADGSLFAAFASVSEPRVQAEAAARAALALRASAGFLAMALTIGRDDGSLHAPVGELLEHTAATLQNARPGEILVDAKLASLLEGLFETAAEERGICLVRERPVEAVRTLLGKPARWVGRRHDLGLLRALYDGCIDEPRARAVVVTAPAGVGKSRLAQELLRSLHETSPSPSVLRGQGDSLSAGSPFGLIASALRRAAGVLDGEAVEIQRDKLRERIARSLAGAALERVTAFLGEVAGVRFPEGSHAMLREARKDAMLLGDAMRAAWEDFLRAECDASPVVLVLEELHWGDLPSIKFVDAALRSLRDRPFLVLALARPEVDTIFPGLFADRDAQNLRLSVLSRKASAELVRGALGEDADAELVDRLVSQAGGNAFFLEELVRAVASGAPGSLPPTVLGALGVRLDALGPEAKRILRAASVFGEVFWEGGVGALAGAAGDEHVHAWLEHLVEREVIARRPEARIPGEREYAFCHALVREAAYAMLTQDDRPLGHRLAGAWLERAGSVDALTLAEHFVRGDDPARAVRWFLRAADQALEGNDLHVAAASAERAVAAGAAGEELGRARLLQASAAFWRSAYADALRRSEEAAELLPRGGADFFRALGTAIVASAVLGATAEVDRRLEELAGIEPAPGGESAQLVALSRGCFQLIFAGRFEVADAILARITERAALLLRGPIDPPTSSSVTVRRFDAIAVAQVHHVIGLREAHRGDVSALLQHLEAAIPAFERAFDMRNALVERTSMGACYDELGDFERAEQIVRDNLAACERAGAARATTYARGYLGYILIHREGKLDEARRLLEQVIEEYRAAGNRRYEGLLRTDLAIALHLAGDLAGSEAEARKASELLAAGLGFRSRALAVLGRALLGLGRAPEALAAAREAKEILERLGGLIVGESLPPLILAEALLATGDAEAAEKAARDAKVRLARRAARIADPRLRQTFLASPDSIRTLALPTADHRG